MRSFYTVYGSHGDDLDNEFTVTMVPDTGWRYDGRGGDDVITALGESNRGVSFEGGSGNDYLQAADVTDPANSNILDGGAGADTMVGAVGRDYFHVRDAADVVLDATVGDSDWVKSTMLRYTLPDTIENFRGLASIDTSRGPTARGNALDNRMIGTFRDDVLLGLTGRDSLWGDGGNDILVGGLGGDLLQSDGRVETDFTTFRYDRTLDSSRAFGWDRIIGLEADDLIDVSRIDANRASAGTNESFVFIGGEAFSEDATGQIRYERVDETTVAILVSTDADVAAEMRILLKSSVVPTEFSFVL